MLKIKKISGHLDEKITDHKLNPYSHKDLSTKNIIIKKVDNKKKPGKSLIKKEKTNKISVLTPDLPGKQEQVCSILSDPNL